MVDLDILNLRLILLELGVSLLLRVEMREDLIVEPQLEGLALLDDVQREPVQREGILEGDVGRQLVLQQDLAVHGDLDLAGNEAEVQHDEVRLVLEGHLPRVTLLAALHVLPHLLTVEPQRLNLLHSKINISMLLRLLLPLLLPLALALPEPVYTLHYLKNYLRENAEKQFGCGKSIVYGTYIYPLGPVDGLYALLNGNMLGFNNHCQRPDTYVKIFGNGQNYQQLLDGINAAVDQIVNAVARTGVKKLILEWKYLPEEDKRAKAREELQRMVVDLEARGYQVYVKAPASYFCLDVAGKKYILDLPASRFIVELYGEEPGKYITYDSIFGVYSHSPDPGYTQTCPKYPTRTHLTLTAPQKQIYLQKTLDSHEPGYIGSTWQTFLTQAGQKQYGGVYFYDGFPLQTVDL